jgi:putative membrane protein insertion efficiency factor
MADTHLPHMGSEQPERNGIARLRGVWRTVARLPRRSGHYLIRFYQLTFSAFAGRQCRYLPTCSSYMDEAIARHGLYAGAMMGLARICRCHPMGNYGFDPVPQHLPAGSYWLRPWRYGDWQGPLHCDEIFAPTDTEPPDLDAGPR